VAWRHVQNTASLAVWLLAIALERVREIIAQAVWVLIPWIFVSYKARKHLSSLGVSEDLEPLQRLLWLLELSHYLLLDQAFGQH
jgi:hypothetical protein